MRAYRGGEPCPKCSDGSTTREGECLKCGALWGAAFLCPHCGQHTKPVVAPLVRAACSACGKPRLGAELSKDAYDVILAKLRGYRMWHARALFYVPVMALGLAVYVGVAMVLPQRVGHEAARLEAVARAGTGQRGP